jgi:hypothetical protein
MKADVWAGCATNVEAGGSMDVAALGAEAPWLFSAGGMVGTEYARVTRVIQTVVDPHAPGRAANGW